MRMYRFGATICALLLAGGATPALAQTAPRVAEFRSGGVIFSVPIPDGYCEPSGKGIETAQFNAAADADNVTLLTLFPCDSIGDQPDYYIVKAPKTALFAAVTRSEMLAGMGSAFDSPAVQEALSPDRLNGKAGKAFSDLSHRQVDVDGAIHPAGRDDTCAYLAGTIGVTSGTINYSRSVSACLTSIADRIIFVYRFGEGAKPGNARALLPSAKALAVSISGKPAQ